MEEQLDNKKPVVVGITGASGVVLAKSTIDRFLELDVPVILTASSASRIVWEKEMETSFGEELEKWSSSQNFKFHQIGELTAPIASGTFPTRGMVIIPASMSTVGALAQGLSDNLLRRAADVSFKEKRTVVVVPRETPLHAVHLRNLSDLAFMGATILPPNPAFYLFQKSVNDVVDFIVERVMVLFGVVSELPEGMQYKKDLFGDK
ncbi:MAG: UbiX family flavin prenyltransferase [SAR202 cluster bacterium]|nr:UbiX family flavin prenyltransferase [SAR202 cluster bacterium]MQG39279.1 UbiX family flavin prenyltransferase [SAR202 cluster bacterium]|tara:strand:- start:3602 stop:4219 length:618 start_codon:yes stop_codon:yes gene_type:complete